MKLILPYPVSANRYWRTFAYKAKATGKAAAVTVVSDEAKTFKAECGWRAKEAGIRTPLGGPIDIRVRLVPKNLVCMDLDNCLKVTLDALKGIVFEDDSQVYRILAERGDPDPAGSRLEVEVLPLVMPTALELAA